MTVILAHYIPATTSELEHWTCLHTILLIAHFPAQSRFLLPSPPATSLNRYVFLVFIMLANLVHATLKKTLCCTETQKSNYSTSLFLPTEHLRCMDNKL